MTGPGLGLLYLRNMNNIGVAQAWLRRPHASPRRLSGKNSASYFYRVS